MPKLNSLSGDIFLRALQSLDKLISTWLQAGEKNASYQVDSNANLDRKLPDANTLFEIYGDLIFGAAAIEKSSHDQGRAIAITIICRILSKYQYREPVLDAYLSSCCSCLSNALSGDALASATAIFHLESLIVSGHTGILCLVVPIFLAIRRIVPQSRTIKSPLQNVSLETLRMCCYQMLNLFYCFFSGFDCPINLKQVVWDSIKPLEHSLSSEVFNCYSKFLKNHPILFKAHLLDTLIGSLLIEDNSNNVRFLLNSISSILYTDYRDFPETLPFLVYTFEKLLCKPPAAWSFSPAALVDTQITIVRVLEQWSRLGNLEFSQAHRLCMSLINLTVSLHSKANLPLYFRLIIATYETILSWFSVSKSPIDCISAFISALVKFMNNEPASPHKPNSKPSSIVNASLPASPTIYGVKNRKSLAERVFTLEFGLEDQRPESLSPSLLKGFDEIFLEYTDSILQRLLCFHLQEQINTNYPVKLDSCCDDLCSFENVKYYAISSSILVGFTDSMIFVRNSIGKFAWHQEYKPVNESATIKEQISTKDSDSMIIDHDLSNLQLSPFKTSIVVTELDDDVSNEILLNDSKWTVSLDNNQQIASKITPILAEVENHLNSEIVPEIPKNSRFNRVKSQISVSVDEPEIISRLFLTHLGFLSAGTHSLVSPLAIKDSLISDLKKLDSMPSRESFNIPIYFIPSNYKAVDQTDQIVSKSFESFIKELGRFDETFLGPILTFDTSLKVNFPIVHGITGSSSTIYEDQSNVSIIWSEDSETLKTLPVSNSNFVHFLVTPVLIKGEKGKFFRIRILLARSLQSEYNSLQNISNVSPLMSVSL